MEEVCGGEAINHSVIILKRDVEDQGVSRPCNTRTIGLPGRLHLRYCLKGKSPAPVHSNRDDTGEFAQTRLQRMQLVKITDDFFLKFRNKR